MADPLRPKRRQVRGQSNLRQPLQLDPYSPERRAHDDVVDTDGGRADRLRLRDRPVLRTLRTDARSPTCCLSRRPRDFGLALISCGVLALLIAVWQYLWIICYLWGGSFAPIAGPTREGVEMPVLAIAVLLMCIGLFAFFAVLLRLV